MNKALARDFFTGLVVMIALIGLAVLLIRFGEVRLALFRSRMEFQVQVDNAGGLKEGSPVTLNGVKVGQIADSRVLPPPAVGAELTLSIDHGVTIPRSAMVSVDRSFVGESSLEFSIPKGVSPQALADVVRPGETVVQSDMLSLNGKLGTLADTVDATLQRLTRTADGIDKLAATYVKVGERLDELLEPRTLDDVRSGKAPNLRTTLARADTALAAAESWLTDEQLKADTRDIIAKTKKTLDDAGILAQKWSTAADTVGNTLTNSAAKLDSTLGKADAAMTTVTDSVAKIREAATGVATLVEGINAGKGTAGQLATNPDLYNGLRDAATRLDRALADFQDLIEKLKKEGIRVGL